MLSSYCVTCLCRGRVISIATGQGAVRRMHFAPPTCNQLDHVASSLMGPSLSARVCCLFVNGAFGVWELDSRNELRAVGCLCLFLITDEDLSLTYLAHHELESEFSIIAIAIIIIIIIMIAIIIIVIIVIVINILITGHAFKLLSGGVSVKCMHSCVLCAAMSVLCILRSIMH